MTEAARVLRPSGLFVFQEVIAHGLSRLTYRTLFEHHRDKRFSADEFTHEIERRGLRLLKQPRKLCFGDFALGVVV